MTKITDRMNCNSINKEDSGIKKIKNWIVERVFKKEQKLERPLRPNEIHKLLDDLVSHSAKANFNKFISSYGSKVVNPDYLLSQIQLIHDKHSRNSALNKLVEFELKIIGHDFNIGGEIEIKNKKTHAFYKIIGQKVFGLNSRKVRMEGYDRVKAHGKVADAMENFLCTKRNGKENLSEKETLIIEALHKSAGYDPKDLNAKAKEILNDIKSGKPVTIPTGWQGHAVEVTIHNGLMCYSNLGRSTKNFNHGMYVYKINPEKIDKKFIKKLLRTCSYYPNAYTILLRDAEVKDRMKWFESAKGMFGQLEGEPVMTLLKQQQSVENCTFAAAKCGAEALELLFELKDVKQVEKNSSEFELFLRKEQFSFFLNLVSGIQKSDRKNKILSDASEFRVISEICQKFFHSPIEAKKAAEYLDEILEDKFFLEKYKIKDCIVDLHNVPQNQCKQYIGELLTSALPGSFIIYKDSNKNIWLDGKNLNEETIHQKIDLKNIQSLSDLKHLNLKYPVANHAQLRWIKRNKILY